MSIGVNLQPTTMSKYSAAHDFTLENHRDMDPIRESFSSGNSLKETWRIHIDYESRSWDLVLSARLEHDLSDVVVSIYSKKKGRIVKESLGNITTHDESKMIYDIFEFTFDKTNLGELTEKDYIPLVLTVSYSTLPQSHLMATLSKDFERLLLSGDTSDVVFDVDGEEIPAHRNILSTRLTYFRRLFNADMREAMTRRVAIEDIDATSFKAVLKFLYCGRLPEDLKTSPENYLRVAEKYDIRELKRASEHALARSITRDNVVEVLIMADMFNCDVLKRDSINRFMSYRKCLSDEQLAPLKAHPDLMLECFKKAW